LLEEQQQALALVAVAEVCSALAVMALLLAVPGG
jgi:hypothetical protein